MFVRRTTLWVDKLVAPPADFHDAYAALKALAIRLTDRRFFIGQQVPAGLFKGEGGIAFHFLELRGRLALPLKKH